MQIPQSQSSRPDRAYQKKNWQWAREMEPCEHLAREEPA